jgi:hypothetical protein
MLADGCQQKHMHRFHSGLPPDCPPEKAIPFEGTLYRGIKITPMTAADFLSYREANKKCTASECDCWGLSVWTTREAVDHARKTIRYIKKWYIAAGQVVPDDGLILHTPSEAQPEHHTFWRDVGRDLVSRFSVILDPVIP